MHLPTDRFYLATHQWLRTEGDDCWQMGITPFAAESLGDIVYVALPEVEVTVAQGEPLFVVESVKTASEVAAPSHVLVLAANGALRDRPELLNDAPLQHWIVYFRAETPIDPAQLLTADQYAALLAQ